MDDGCLESNLMISKEIIYVGPTHHVTSLDGGTMSPLCALLHPPRIPRPNARALSLHIGFMKAKI